MNFWNREIKQREKQRKLNLLLEDQVVQAEQVRNFFATDLGKYIEQKIEYDIQAVKNQLVYAKEEEVFALQDEFRMINRIKLYLATAITSGTNAEQALGLRHTDDE